MSFSFSIPSKPKSNGLNLRELATGNDDFPMWDRGETISEIEARKLRENLEKFPEDNGLDEFTHVPVEGFGAALLSRFGWKEGKGIGRNAENDVKVAKVTKKTGREGLGFTGKIPKNRTRDKVEFRKEKVKKDKNRLKRVNWLRNHIRVRIISNKLKGGELFLKKAVVMDVVGLRMCDIAIDESGELVQGVNQEFLEAVLPELGGPVIVLYGEHKGVYGSLFGRDLEKETGVVRDEDTHEMFNVRLEQIAEYTGDPSDIGY